MAAEMSTLVVGGSCLVRVPVNDAGMLDPAGTHHVHLMAVYMGTKTGTATAQLDTGTVVEVPATSVVGLPQLTKGVSGPRALDTIRSLGLLLSEVKQANERLTLQAEAARVEGLPEGGAPHDDQTTN